MDEIFSSSHRGLANAVVFGQSGSGKTVLKNMLIAQLLKFHQPEIGRELTIVDFDKDLGSSIAVPAMGGKYYALKNGLQSGWNPFHLPPNPKNITFLNLLVGQLVHHPNMDLTPAEQRAIHQAIDGVMSVEDMSKRRLSSVLEFFNPNEVNGLYDRLAKWCEGGANGWLFDNPVDTLSLGDLRLISFDITDFLDNAETRLPTMMYLFHRIGNLIDGRRIPIFIDEVMKPLRDKYFSDLIFDKLFTIRKQDGFLVLFAQSPGQLLGLDVSEAIITQTALKICFPDPGANRSHYVDHFKFTEREFEIISKELSPNSRMFLAKHNHNSVVLDMNLQGFEDELAVFSGNTATATLAEQLIGTFGNNPQIWLPHFQQQRKALAI